MKKKNIIILGAGFGGIATYKSLPKKIRKQHHITIVNKENYFLFTPLIHEVATGALNSYHVTEPIRKLIGTDTCFIQSTVESIDVENKQVILKDNVISYDILVVGLGAKTNFFNVPGAEKYAYTLKTLDDAKHVRNRFLDVFERASLEKDSEKRKKMLEVVIVGGGPTGVELVAEAAELFFDSFHNYYSNFIDFNEVSLSLVNSGEALLVPFSEKFKNYAEKTLIKKQVKVINNTRISEVHVDGVTTSKGHKISAETIVWTAGVQAQNINCSLYVNEIDGCFVVNDYLQLPHYKDVFVIGDIAHSPTTDGRGLPKLAQVAKQQGKTTGKNIARILNGKDAKKFTYKSRGNLASLGQWHAIADLPLISFTGPVAWFLWRTIYLHNFISWRKRFKITLDWTINIFSHRDITQL